MVSHRNIPDVHQQPINRVLFAPDAKVIMTSSESDRTSVVFTKVTLKAEPKVWSVEQVVLGDPDRLINLIICPHVITWWMLFQWKREPQAPLKFSEVPTQQDRQLLCKALLKWVVMLPVSHNGCF